MSGTPPVVLTIAGFDPSSGAGVTADIKTIAAHDCFGISCITALTVQSTMGVRRIQAVEPGIVRATLEELVSDLEIAGVHIGMLGTSAVVQTVADFLAKAKLPHIVLDPVLKSTSGAELLDSAGTKLMIQRLLPLAEVITPNRTEAGILTGLPVSNRGELEAAAARLHDLGVVNVVITGGDTETAADFCSFTTSRGFETQVFESVHLHSNSTHGTGCAFSTALTCNLALKIPMTTAVELSKAYVAEAIAQGQTIGHGVGPLHHLFRRG